MFDNAAQQSFDQNSMLYYLCNRQLNNVEIIRIKDFENATRQLLTARGCVTPCRRFYHWTNGALLIFSATNLELQLSPDEIIDNIYVKNKSAFQ